MRTSLAALVVMLSIGAAKAEDMTPMSIDQMRAMIIGNSMSGTTEAGDEYVEHYIPGGRIVGLLKSRAHRIHAIRWLAGADGYIDARHGARLAVRALTTVDAAYFSWCAQACSANQEPIPAQR